MNKQELQIVKVLNDDYHYVLMHYSFGAISVSRHTSLKEIIELIEAEQNKQRIDQEKMMLNSRGYGTIGYAVGKAPIPQPADVAPETTGYIQEAKQDDDNIPF